MLLNATKVLLEVTLVLHNVKIKPLNVRKKKIKEPLNITRELSHDIGTAQCENRIIKCEKKVREPMNVTKELSHMMLELYNVRIEPSNMKKK